jgi:M6 family metalloprotease-like protein
MRQIYLTLVFALLAVQYVFAVPANPTPVQKTQSDGTVIIVRIKGDEKVNWLESLDGYTLMYNNQRDIVFAVKNADGDLQPSEILYRGEDLTKYSVAEKNAIEKIARRQFYSAKQIQTLNQIWDITDSRQAKNSKATDPVITPVVGEKKMLCILVNFTNKIMVKTSSEFDNLMNQLGYTTDGRTGSVRDFYRANSYGKMDVAVTVAGPFNLSNTTSYYASGGDYDFGPDVAALADPTVDFSEYAVNGSVPTFHIIFAGYGDEAIDDGQQIWSHKWSFYEYMTLDGVLVGESYSCSPELRGSDGSDLTEIGVICHEMCHGFGAPDYYDTDYETGGEHDGTGVWDLMASGSWNGPSGDGGRTPAQINIFQKILFGWVNPVRLNTGRTVTAMPNSVDSAMAYIIKANPNGDMYVLENRQQKGWDSYVPGSGLLIYHVHPDANAGSIGSNNLNTRHPQKMYVVDADSDIPIPNSDPDSYGWINYSTAAFGGTNTSFTSTSTPRMFYWSGSSGVVVDKPITEINRNASSETVSFKFMNGDPTSVDVALTEIVEPEPYIHKAGMQNVKVKLENQGIAITSATIEWTIDGVSQTPYTWTGNLDVAASEIITLGTDNFGIGSHTITATVIATGDINLANNTTTKTIKVTNPFFTETFEGGVANWTFNNGSETNKWISGGATASEGNKSAYISNNNSDNTYTIMLQDSKVHLWRDITFPASTDDFDLYFDVRCMAEYDGTAYDYMEVRIVPTTTTPYASSFLSGGMLIGKYYNIDNWQTVHKPLPVSYSGTTQRLVFSWYNDDYVGTQPPAAIDNIAVALRSDIVVGNDDVEAARQLRALVQNDILYISGLTVGQSWRVYNTAGTLVQQGVADGDGKAETRLLVKGVYIIESENRTVKVINL